MSATVRVEVSKPFDTPGQTGVERLEAIGDRCRANKPVDAARALAAARRDGIDYDAATRGALTRCAQELGVSSPLESA